jgi:peptidoglycan biosynthesis protein MviN/MurJ (putative lipid II flippase)
MIGTVIFAFGSVLFDNSLVLYMTLLVYKSNRKKHQEPAMQAFKRAITTSLCVMLMDWVSLGFLCWMYTAASYTTALYHILEYLLVLTSGVHCCLLYLVFLRIRDLALTGLKKHPQRAIPPTSQSVMLTEKDTEIQYTKDTQIQ